MTKSSLHAQFMAAVIAGRLYSMTNIEAVAKADQMLSAFLARWPHLKLED